MNERTTLATVELGSAGLFGLHLKVEKLNKRAKRHGMNMLEVRILRDFTVTNEKTGFADFRYDVEIVGSAPCINGWHLTAVIERDETIGTLVKVVPGKFEDDDYSGYRDSKFDCDHCGFNRGRNKVYILKNDEGFAKSIGSNCLADYVRTDDAADFARYAEFCDEAGNFTDAGLAGDADEAGFGSRGGHPNVRLETFLSAVQTCTRKFGWTSRSAAYNDPGLTATADDAYYLLFGSGPAWEKWVSYNELHIASNGDNDLAGKAAEWAANLTTEQTAKNEYLDTIHRIGLAGETSGKLAGYAASINNAYLKDQEWAAERAEKAAGAKEKDYLGEVGKTADRGVVTVLGVHYSDGNYGVTSIVRMKADLPNGKEARIVWFASGEREFETGAEYTLRSGIKACNDDPKYGKQTVVTRAKLTPVK